MSKFDFNKYMGQSPKYVKVLWNDGFEIKTGVEREYYPNLMDYESNGLLRYGIFRVTRVDGVGNVELISYKNDTDYYLSDTQEILVQVLKRNVWRFFQDYPFTPNGFDHFLKTLFIPKSEISKMTHRSQNTNM